MDTSLIGHVHVLKHESYYHQSDGDVHVPGCEATPSILKLIVVVIVVVLCVPAMDIRSNWCGLGIIHPCINKNVPCG